MKIKNKKTMNLPQLIEWGFENNITNKEYICNEYGAKSVIFNLSRGAGFSDEFSYNPHDTFTVEVEEEITENTEITELYMRYNNDCIDKCYGMSISKFDKSRVKSFYIPNDDLTMTLIWTREKGLVD